MKVGDLVKIFCTCGESHDADPMLGVLMELDDEQEMVKILWNGREAWVSIRNIEVTSTIDRGN